MPGPLMSQVQLNQYITDMSVAWIQAQTSFIATRVFPFLGVKKQSGSFPVFPKRDFQTDLVRRVPFGGAYRRAGYNVEPDTYNCVKWGLEHPIPREVRENEDDPISVDQAGAVFLSQKFLIRLERLFDAAMMQSTSWDLGSAVTTKWDLYDTSTPIEDIHDAIVSFILGNGVPPNIFSCGIQVDQKLKDHPNVLARYKVTNADSITDQMMARLLGVDEYIVSKAVYETADDGPSVTDVPAFISGKNALLTNRPATPSLMTPASGYTMAWKGGTGNAAGVAIDDYYEPQTKSDIFQGDMYVHPKQGSSSLGFWFGACVS